jgi:acyl dehydratase
MSLQFEQIDVGYTLPALTLPAINRTTLALFAGASGDHNPIHIDSDFAKAAGMPDVFAHGMLSMAYLGRLITQWVPQAQLRQFNARFVDITHLGDIPCCTGRVVKKLLDGEQRLLRIEIQCANQQGQSKIVGDALIAC